MFKSYNEAYNAAVLKGRALRDGGMPDKGCDIGLEFNKLFKTYTIFMLPYPENRYGHETRCEVVALGSPLLELVK